MCWCRYLPYLSNDCLLLIVGVESRYHSRCKHVIDQLKESCNHAPLPQSSSNVYDTPHYIYGKITAPFLFRKLDVPRSSTVYDVPTIYTGESQHLSCSGSLKCQAQALHMMCRIMYWRIIASSSQGVHVLLYCCLSCVFWAPHLKSMHDM